jgi:hypothetical protein
VIAHVIAALCVLLTMPATYLAAELVPERLRRAGRDLRRRGRLLERVRVAYEARDGEAW